MKNKFLLIIFAIFSLIIIYPQSAQASPVISDIKINDLQEGWVKIEWSSSEDTTGYLVFGEDQNNLKFSVGSMVLGKRHSADMTGLKKDKAYYFKIIAISKTNGRSETFIQYLDTDNMKDSRGAVFSNFKKVQITDKVFVSSFLTDEKSKIEFRYGTERDNLNKYVRNNSLKTEHNFSIKNLNPGTTYFFQIIAKDDDDNITSYYGNFNTSSNSIQEIKINNLLPGDYGQAPMMPEKTIISFESNILATAEVFYGTDPKNLKQRTKVTTNPSLNHQIILNKLTPDTTYFYQLRLKSDFVKNTFNSQIYSFKTASLNQAYLNNYFQDGDLVKYKSTTYLLHNEAKTPIYNKEKIKTISSQVKTIEEIYLNEYDESDPYWGIFHDGQVVKEAKKNTVYLIDGEYKRPIANWQVFTYLNYKSSDVITASSAALRSYKEGEIVGHSKEITSLGNLNNSLIKSASSPVVYLVVNDKKLPFLTEAAFNKKGYNFSQVKIISDSLLKSIEDGQVII